MGAVLSSERDFVFFGENFSRYALEVETGGELFARLIDRVVEFLRINFGNLRIGSHHFDIAFGGLRATRKRELRRPCS
jgi:hypothetical protein